jgi:sialic acid synthase SpsE
MLYAATALGCRVLEKGVCTDAKANDQDVFHALPIGRLNEVKEKCGNIHAALGDPEQAFCTPETRPAARMGVMAATELQPGDRVQLDRVRFAFPTLGVPVEEWDRLEGRTVTEKISAGQPLEWNHVASAEG